MWRFKRWDSAHLGGWNWKVYKDLGAGGIRPACFVESYAWTSYIGSLHVSDLLELMIIVDNIDTDLKLLSHKYCRGEDVYLLNSGLGNAEEQNSLEELLSVETPSADDSGQFHLKKLEFIWGSLLIMLPHS